RPSVRLEALNSLSRIRPVNAPAGQAIERAAASDENWRVRLQAKSASMKYHLAGYAAPKTESSTTGPRPTTTAEPPLSEPTNTPPTQPTTTPSNPLGLRRNVTPPVIPGDLTSPPPLLEGIGPSLTPVP